MPPLSGVYYSGRWTILRLTEDPSRSNVYGPPPATRYGVGLAAGWVGGAPGGGSRGTGSSTVGVRRKNTAARTAAVSSKIADATSQGWWTGRRLLAGDREAEFDPAVDIEAATGPGSTTSRRTRRTVMLSGPPAWLASSTSRRAAISGWSASARVRAIVSSSTGPVKPSLHNSNQSPGRSSW